MTKMTQREVIRNLALLPHQWTYVYDAPAGYIFDYDSIGNNLDCQRCSDCKDCCGCVDCVGCEACTDCVDCYKCTKCVDCEACDNCEGCKMCSYLTYHRDFELKYGKEVEKF